MGYTTNTRMHVSPDERRVYHFPFLQHTFGVQIRDDLFFVCSEVPHKEKCYRVQQATSRSWLMPMKCVNTMTNAKLIGFLRTWWKCHTYGQTELEIEIGEKFLTWLERRELARIENRTRSRMARRIQDAWRVVVSNPYHAIGKRRLLREFHEMESQS